jgi:hypothetical protein
MKKSINKNRMIAIKSNGIIKKYFPCTIETLDKTFAKAIDIAGGMWNGKDEFKVEVL